MKDIRSHVKHISDSTIFWNKIPLKAFFKLMNSLFDVKKLLLEIFVSLSHQIQLTSFLYF